MPGKRRGGHEAERLTPEFVLSVEKPGRYFDGLGLVLSVSKTGSKSWLHVYSHQGKARQMGLGPCRPEYRGASDRDRVRAMKVHLEHIRRLNSAVLQQRLRGDDPLTEKEGRRQAMREAEARRVTFDAAAKQYITLRRGEWRSEVHARQWVTTLRDYVSPRIGNKPLAELTREDVLGVLDPIWVSMPSTGPRVRERIEAVWLFGKSRGWCSGDCPATWKGGLQHALANPAKIHKVEHHAALDWRDVPDFMDALRKQPGLAAWALELTILCATRTRETIEARWCEIDGRQALWTIPAERMKAHREHRIPLTTAALDIIGALSKLRAPDDPQAFLFPGRVRNKPLSNMAMLVLLQKRMNRDVTVHGFRSAFRDWAAESTTYPREVCEQALAHGLPDKTEAAYLRSDLLAKRCELMQDWASHCLSKVPRFNGA